MVTAWQPAGAIDYYVNDNSTADDMYTSAVGSSGNDGLTAATPKAYVQEILSAYELDPGDTVYVDTGLYQKKENITLDALDSGGVTNPVYVIGSTNGVGTTIDRLEKGTVSKSAFLLLQTTNIVVQHFRCSP